MATPAQVREFEINERECLGRRNDNPFIDDLRAITCGNLMDSINAAWNGWEQACKCEDEGLQNYYMKYVITLHRTLQEIKGISKS